MRANGFGAHQLTRPSTCMNAGTSSIRTSVASASTATVDPVAPNNVPPAPRFRR